MAKKKKNIKQNPDDSFLKALPQNILFIGEKGDADKDIYISQSTHKEIREFSENKTEVECGGMLIGCVIEEFGKTNIIIHGFVEAKYSEGTPTTLKFTHETWEYVHSEIAKKYKGMKIVGWIHTHPDFGIFLSEYDKFIQTNFFSDENQIALVVDPIQKSEGFYYWINGKIERCGGYYLFDKTGVKINAETAAPEKEDSSITVNKVPFIYPLVIGILFACIIFLTFFCLSLNSKIYTLQKQQIALTESANSALASMQQQIQAILLNSISQGSDATMSGEENGSAPADTENGLTDETETTEESTEPDTLQSEESTSGTEAPDNAS
jgi:proteasome lid subunit RPN8/RPN11